jgi:hypothetical protein
MCNANYNYFVFNPPYSDLSSHSIDVQSLQPTPDGYTDGKTDEAARKLPELVRTTNTDHQLKM